MKTTFKHIANSDRHKKLKGTSLKCFFQVSNICEMEIVSQQMDIIKSGSE